MHRRPLRASAALAAVLGVLATACGASPQPATPTAAEAGAIAPVEQVPATAEVLPAVEPVVVPETVEPRTAELEVRPEAGLARDAVFTATTVQGVDVVAPIRAVEATMATLTGDRSVTVAAVDATTFRPFTPEVTAQEPAVWERLAAGEALVRHDVAHAMELELGGTVLLVTERGTVELRIGAFASNGAPPIADVVVPWEVGAQLGQEEASLLLVDLMEGEKPRTVSTRVSDALGGAKVTERRPPSAMQASLHANGAVRIDPFSYTDMGDGTIRIDPAWVSKWIVRVDLPRVGRAYVNRVMAPQLLAAMQELERRGLIDEMDPSQFAGGWVARHIDWNPAKPLSMHAWGLAVDFNSRDNCLGCKPTMSAEVVEVFERWGFAWGGRWSRPDGMHFELERVVTPN